MLSPSGNSVDELTAAQKAVERKEDGQKARKCDKVNNTVKVLLYSNGAGTSILQVQEQQVHLAEKEEDGRTCRGIATTAATADSWLIPPWPRPAWPLRRPPPPRPRAAPPRPPPPPRSCPPPRRPPRQQLSSRGGCKRGVSLLLLRPTSMHPCIQGMHMLESECQSAQTSVRCLDLFASSTCGC